VSSATCLEAIEGGHALYIKQYSKINQIYITEIYFIKIICSKIILDNGALGLLGWIPKYWHGKMWACHFVYQTFGKLE